MLRLVALAAVAACASAFTGLPAPHRGTAAASTAAAPRAATVVLAAAPSSPSAGSTRRSALVAGAAWLAAVSGASAASDSCLGQCLKECGEIVKGGDYCAVNCAEYCKNPDPSLGAEKLTEVDGGAQENNLGLFGKNTGNFVEDTISSAFQVGKGWGGDEAPGVKRDQSVKRTCVGAACY